VKALVAQGLAGVGELEPGAHLAVLTSEVGVGVEGRLLGLELRDTLLVLRPGPTSGFVFLFRVPFEGTVAAQMLATGTGGLNVDACRIEGIKQATAGRRTIRWGVDEGGCTYEKGTGAIFTTTGRWPPNVLLVHSPGCVQAGTRRVPSGVAVKRNGVTGGHIFGSNLGKAPVGTADQTYADADGLETVAAWECELGCPVPVLDAISGELSSGTGAPPVRRRAWSGFRGGDGVTGKPEIAYGDTGGASRFYPQFSGEDEMRAWLTKLVTP
jgi:hypothetical protein